MWLLYYVEDLEEFIPRPRVKGTDATNTTNTTNRKQQKIVHTAKNQRTQNIKISMLENLKW